MQYAPEIQFFTPRQAELLPLVTLLLIEQRQYGFVRLLGLPERGQQLADLVEAIGSHGEVPDRVLSEECDGQPKQTVPDGSLYCAADARLDAECANRGGDLE